MVRSLAQLAGLATAAEQEMQYFGILSPTFGEREDIPSILLPDAFTVENENVILQDGEIHRMQARLPEFCERAYTTGTVSADGGGGTPKVVTGSGTGWLSGANHKPDWVGRKIRVPQVETNWARPTSDSGTEWTDREKARDGLTDTYAYIEVGDSSWSELITFVVDSISSDAVKITAHANDITAMTLEVQWGGSWHTISTTGFSWFPRIYHLGGIYTVTGVRMKFYNSSSEEPVNAMLFEVAIRDVGATAEYTIASVDSATQITLVEDFAGTVSGVTYSIGTPGEKVPTPDGNAIIKYHQFVKQTGTSSEYLLGFTKDHIYLWSHPWSAWILKFTCGSSCTRWSVTTINNKTVATNNVDKIQVWGSTISDLFTNVGGASGIDVGGGTYIQKAICVFSHEGRLHIGATTENSTFYPFRDRWSSDPDETDFDETGEGDTGKKDFLECDGVLLNYCDYDSYLLVFFSPGIASRGRIKKMWLTPDELVYETDDVSTELGLLAAESIAKDAIGEVFFLATDFTYRNIHLEEVSRPKRKTFKGINPELLSGIVACYVETHSLIQLAVPYSSEATENNKLLFYWPIEQKWGESDIPVAAFGNYRRQERYTYDTLPFDTNDTWGWDRYDVVTNTVGFPLELVADYSGDTFVLHAAELDDGSEYTGYCVLSTDLTAAKNIHRSYQGPAAKMMRQYKIIQQIQLMVRTEAAGTLNVSIKADSAKTFTSVGSVSLVNTDKDIIIVDVEPPSGSINIRGRMFLPKISGSSKFSLLGIIFGYMLDGDN